METTLIVVAVASIAAAIVAIGTARRVLRDERARSDARVTALSAAADAYDASHRTWTQGPSPEPHVAVSSGRFFGTVERDEPSGSRLPLLAAATLILLLGGALIFLNTAAPGGGEPVALATPAEPLELVALGHAREATVLTISGTVRNPSSGPKLEGLTAVVSLLDRSGALVSTKDVPLDYRALGPGEETPFKVRVPGPGAIARYRVSFRAGSDVIPHVDRRTTTKLASAVQ